MPYIYTVYEVKWNQDETEYEKQLICTGTPEQLVASGAYKTKKVLVQAFGENIRARQNKRGTRRIFERKWKPEPGEEKPISGLPDSLEDVYPAAKNGKRSSGYHSCPKYGRRKTNASKKYSCAYTTQTPLAADVHKVIESNKIRALAGRPPLSYGQWRAGLG